MRVRSLFFASYRSLTGTSELTVELPEGTTVSGLIHDLRSRGGRFSELPTEPAVAVNREYCDLSQPLQDGDEVALLPPVAGG